MVLSDGSTFGYRAGVNPQEVVAALTSLNVPARTCDVSQELNQGYTSIRVDCDDINDPNSRITLTYRLDDFLVLGRDRLVFVVGELVHLYEEHTGMAAYPITYTNNQPITYTNTIGGWNNSNGILYNGDPRDREIARLREELEALKGEKDKAEEESAVASILDVIAKRTKESMSKGSA